MNILKILAYFFLLIAVLVALHQYVGWGYLWEWEDLHHEGFMMMFGFAGIVLLIIRRGG